MRKSGVTKSARQKSRAKEDRKKKRVALGRADAAEKYISEFVKLYGDSPKSAMEKIKLIEDGADQLRADIARELLEEHSGRLKSLEDKESAGRKKLLDKRDDFMALMEKETQDIEFSREGLKTGKAAFQEEISKKRSELEAISANVEKEVSTRMVEPLADVARRELYLVDCEISFNEKSEVNAAWESELLKLKNSLDARMLDIVQREEYINDVFLGEDSKARSRRLRERGNEIRQLGGEIKAYRKIQRDLHIALRENTVKLAQANKRVRKNPDGSSISHAEALEIAESWKSYAADAKAMDEHAQSEHAQKEPKGTEMTLSTLESSDAAVSQLQPMA